MIHREYGVQATVLDRWDLPGTTRIVMHFDWKTEPGWIELSFDLPALCVTIEEIGGHCQVRLHPDRPIPGEYFGAGHLSLAAAKQPISIYAKEMRQVRTIFYLLDPAKADYLSPSESRAIREMQSRYMFQNEAVQVCATVLGRHQKGEGSPYGLSLTRALMAALLGVVQPQRQLPPPKLTGASLEKVFVHILDNLDQTVTIEELSQIAALPPAQFGKAFKEVTGLSAQRWQMDARVRGAQRLMVDDPEGSLAEIAALTGFSDQSHFSRAFMEIVGISPTAWLHQHK